MARSSLVIFTDSAKADIADIARYTTKQWGHRKALEYAVLLDKGFSKIANREDFSKPALPDDDSVRVCRCEHHYIFYTRREESRKPIIIAILHERMDLLQRIKNRLPDPG